MPFTLVPLNFMTVQPFLGLVGSPLLPWVDRLDTGGAMGFGASNGNEALGVGLSNMTISSDADVLWLYVKKAHRREGIGRALLAALEREARKRGKIRATLRYPRGEQHAGLEHFLVRCGWVTGVETAFQLKVSSEISNAPWFDRWNRPGPFEIFRWVDMSHDERARVDGARLSVPAHFQPGLLEEEMDVPTSLGLRYDGSVVGWLFTHPVTKKELSYTALYVREKLRGTGIAFALVTEAVRRQIEAYGRDSIGRVMIAADNQPMIRIAARRLSPYVLSRVEVTRAEKAHLA